MADEPLDEIEQVTAEVIQQGWIRQEEICAQLGIGQELLKVCLRWEIIYPSETSPEGEALFSDEAIERLSRALRLHHDLGINWAGVSVALDLLDRIEALEHRLDEQSGI